jgi:small subunit ribosomal protein S9
MVKNYTVKSSRKSCMARAVIKPGAGNIRVNNKALDVFSHGYNKDLILEVSGVVPEEFGRYDYFVQVSGGGTSSQTQAVRSCIAKGILLASGNKKALRDKIIAYDRYMVVDDVRNKEPKKQLGLGARKKKQHSKR